MGPIIGLVVDFSFRAGLVFCAVIFGILSRFATKTTRKVALII